MRNVLKRYYNSQWSYEIVWLEWVVKETLVGGFDGLNHFLVAHLLVRPLGKAAHLPQRNSK